VYFTCTTVSVFSNLAIDFRARERQIRM